MKILVLLFVVLTAGFQAKADECGKLSDTKCVVRALGKSDIYTKAVERVKALHPKVQFLATRAVPLITTSETTDVSNLSFLLISEYRVPEVNGTLAILFDVNMAKKSTDAPIDITVGEVYDRTINLIEEVTLGVR